MLDSSKHFDSMIAFWWHVTGEAQADTSFFLIWKRHQCVCISRNRLLEICKSQDLAKDLGGTASKAEKKICQSKIVSCMQKHNKTVEPKMKTKALFLARCSLTCIWSDHDWYYYHSKYFVFFDWLKSPGLFFTTIWCLPYSEDASNIRLTRWYT